MRNSRAVERLEKAQRVAMKIWRDAGVEPDAGQLAHGILEVIDDIDSLEDPGWGERLDAAGERQSEQDRYDSEEEEIHEKRVQDHAR